MTEIFRQKPEEIANDTWLSDFLFRFNAAQDYVQKYPTEENKERWQLMLDIKDAMTLSVIAVINTYNESKKDQTA